MADPEKRLIPPHKVCLMRGKRKGLSNFCKNVLANAIQKRERPYEQFTTKPKAATRNLS